MSIKIDQDLPLPPPQRGRGAPEKWPLSSLRKNDSFFFPSVKPTGFYVRAKSLGIKISTRKVIEDGVTGLRVWRTA